MATDEEARAQGMGLQEEGVIEELDVQALENF